jgi:hypothetical protein
MPLPLSATFNVLSMWAGHVNPAAALRRGAAECEGQENPQK